MKLLIIDDEENMCHMLKAMTERHGYKVTTAFNGADALEIIKNKSFDFILCDVKMPQMDGMTFLEKGAAFCQDSTIIMMSAYGTVDLALSAMKAGAYDFISKPFKADEVLLTLKKAEEREQLRRENRRLKDEIAEIKGNGGFDRMVATSAVMQEVFKLAQKVARYDTTVLITGESGTGKELVARGIHKSSPRANRSFVAINCGSLPENLLESELFGYVKGAFTGADKDSKGLFAEADGSTLFLDEIGELPLAMQVKLLRVLQEQEIRPIGSSKTIKVNVRVLAATAKDLGEQVQLGLFREDLFYRLNVVQIKIPPLRVRRDDIPLLCQHFVEKYNRKFQTRVNGFTEEAMQTILRLLWPGNVRELENIIQRGIVLASGSNIDVNHLPAILERSQQQNLQVTSFENSGECLSLKIAQRRLEAGSACM
jgi:two-component system response regulator AtoC